MDATGGNTRVFDREPIPIFLTPEHRDAIDVELRHRNRRRPDGAPELTRSDILADWLDEFFAAIHASIGTEPPRMLRTAIYQRTNVVELDPWTPRRQ
jgi:hypothetical protein